MEKNDQANLENGALDMGEPLHGQLALHEIGKM